MVKCYAKRCLSFLLALLMCVSMLPVQARAEEAHEHDHAEGTESVAEAETADNAQETLPEEDAVRQVQAQIDAILDRFKITEDLTDEQIADHAIDAEEEDVRITQEEILLLEQDAAFLTEVQFAALERVELFSDFMSVFEELYTVNAVASQTVTVLDGQVEITDSRGTGSASGDTVTITVKAGDWGFWGKTNDITITNATGKKIKIGFNYSASNASELTIAGNTANSSGTYKSDWLDADGTISVTLGAAKSKTATLTLNSFSVEIEQEESQVTFAYDAEGGSVTVAGSAVANGDSQKISLTDGVALVATAKTDYTFLGWIDEDNRILSQEATYTLTPLKDMTVTAVFAKDGGEPWFALGYSEKKSGKPENDSGFFSTSVTYYQVEATYLYRGLTEAAQAAQTSGTDKTLVLMNNATLSAGDYTIPVGVTLLIPFDANNTLYTTAALSKYIGEYIMLKLMSGDAENGFYSAAITCAGVCQFIYTAITDSARPVILTSKKQMSDDYERNISRLYAITTYMALIQGVGFTIFASMIVRILYGEAYLAAIPVLRIQVWMIAFSFMGSVRNIWILAEGKQNLIWKINLAGALLNVLLNALMIPEFGASGASAASLITQIFTNFLLGFLIPSMRDNNRLLIKGLNPVLLLDWIPWIHRET